ncbi:hypothetical protein pb186bvf_006326, partial [Paramecium bursaria]
PNFLMNQYTLRFLDSKAEYLYQEFKISSILQPVFEKCSWLVIFVTIISFFGKLSRGDYLLAILQWVMIAYMLFIIYIIRRHKQFIKYILGLTNFIFVFYQLILTGHEDPYFAYLFGGNSMITHCVILFASEFIEGLIQGILVFSARIIIVKIYSSSPNWEMYVATAIYFLLIEVLIYKCSQGLRTSYLASLKSDQWQNLLIRLVDKHFICFCYDDESVSFQQIFTNNETTNMKQIFRRIQASRTNCRKYIVQVAQTKIDAIYNEKNIGIQVSQFHLDKTFYLAIIDYHEIREDQLINRLLIKNICQTSSLIRKYIKNSNHGFLYKIYFRNLEIINLYKCASNRIKVREFSITKLLKEYTFILKHLHTDTSTYYFSHENFIIQYFKEEIKLFFIRIFNQIKPINQILRILMKRDKNRIKIIIDGSINPIILNTQQQLMKKIFDSYRVDQNCKLYINIQNQYCIQDYSDV